jgi:ADP-ribose pyrophosphatase YjhB (NUDIX family)
MVFRDGEILLIKEKEDDLWSLPGGWADIDESPAEATAREVREESGSLMRAVKLVSLYDQDKHGHRPSPTTSTS